MNGWNVVGLTLMALVLMFLVLRVERRVVWLALLLLVAPAGWPWRGGPAWAGIGPKPGWRWPLPLP